MKTFLLIFFFFSFLSFYNLNTSPRMKEYPLRYAGTDRNKTSHYNLNIIFAHFHTLQQTELPNLQPTCDWQGNLVWSATDQTRYEFGKIRKMKLWTYSRLPLEGQTEIKSVCPSFTSLWKTPIVYFQFVACKLLVLWPKVDLRGTTPLTKINMFCAVSQNYQHMKFQKIIYIL